MTLIDQAGRPIGQKPAIEPIAEARKKLTPRQYISRIIRRIEAALRGNEDQLCQMIVGLASEGWRVCEDKDMGPMKAGVTMVTHLDRDIHGQLQSSEERILRLGSAFTPVLIKLRDEQEKAATRNAEEQAADEERDRKAREAMGAPYVAGEDDA